MAFSFASVIMQSPSNSGGIVQCILLPYNDLTMPHHFFGPNLGSCNFVFKFAKYFAYSFSECGGPCH